ALQPLESEQYVCSPKEKCVATWKDDGKEPPLSHLKHLTVELMTGTDTDQLSLLKNGPLDPNSKSTAFKIPENLAESSDIPTQTAGTTTSSSPSTTSSGASANSSPNHTPGSLSKASTATLDIIETMAVVMIGMFLFENIF
ncbi:2783_t:CDS:2, partial [Acaulospora colombiana]